MSNEEGDPRTCEASKRPRASQRSGASKLDGRLAGENEQTANAMFQALIGQLRASAAGMIGRQRPGHSLQPTALVNEAFLKLFGGQERNWQDDAHMLAVASMAMRQVLVDHARRSASTKRPNTDRSVPLDALVLAYEEEGIDLIALDEALTEFEAFDPEMAKIVRCRYFLGQPCHEIAPQFGISERTLERRWGPTLAWFKRRLL